MNLTFISDHCGFLETIPNDITDCRNDYTNYLQLSIAAKEGNIRNVRKLADKIIGDKHYQINIDNALINAIMESHINIIHALVYDYGANLRCFEDLPLLISVYYGIFDEVEFLLLSNVTINKTLSCSEHDHKEMVRLFSYYGIENITIHQYPDYQISCSERLNEKVKFISDLQHHHVLLFLGNTNVLFPEKFIYQDIKYYHIKRKFVNYQSKHYQIKNSLQKLIWSPNEMGNKLIEYTQNGTIEYIKLLLKHFNCAEKNYYVNEAFIEATRASHIDIMKLLLDNGAIINFSNEKALKESVIYKQSDSIEFLLKNGADIHVNADYLLVIACEIGDLSIIKLLIEKGLDINKNYQPAIKIALERDRMDIIELLM